MRVMSYNIRHDRGGDGANDWLRRLPVVDAMWRRVSADVVGVQEDWPHQSDWLAQQFEGYARVGVGHAADGSGIRIAIFYKRDIFDLREHGDFWLSKTPNEPGSNSFDTKVPRKSTWVRLADRGGREWLVVNTHLDHISKPAREHSARLLRRFVNEHADGACPVVIGDFNADADSPPLRSLTADGLLTDALASVGATTPTLHGFTGEGRHRIDFILIGAPARAGAGEVVTDHQGKVYASDHFPIYADLA